MILLKYPRLTCLIGTFIAAYLLYETGLLDRLSQILNGHGYWSVLLAGFAYSFGFTAAFGTALLIEAAPSVDPAIGALIGGLGAAITDFGLFSLVRSPIFGDELGRLKTAPIIRSMRTTLRRIVPSQRMRQILLWLSAGIIIASPLPDEFGVPLLSATSSLKPKIFSFLCLLLNALGILVILSGAKMVWDN